VQGGLERYGSAGYMLKPLIASPISFAPMTRHRTAMMTALCCPIQSLSSARIRWDRSPRAKYITTGAATPSVATIANTM